MTEQEWRSRFGARLSNMIAARGCTRREFAEECGVSEKQLDHYIHGRKGPNTRSLINMAMILDRSIDELVNFGEMVER